MNSPETKNEESNIQACNGAFSCYGFAWRQMWKYFLELLLVSIVSFLITLPTIGIFDNDADFQLINSISIDLVFFSLKGVAATLFLGLTFILFFQWPLEYGISFVNLKAIRNEKVAVKDMFVVFQNYWNAVFANLLVAVIVGFGFMLIFVPGIIFACKLAFVPYLIVDKKMEAVEAVKESWRITAGYSFTIFSIGLLVIFVAILGLLFFGVGIIISIMWIKLAFAAIYYHVSKSIYKNNNFNIPIT